MSDADDDEYEEVTGDIVRPIIVPELDEDGLIVQPDEDSAEQQRLEAAARARAVAHGHYADPKTPNCNVRTYDPAGNYPCGECNMYYDDEEDGEDQCLLVDVDRVDPKAGSCGHWEDRCAGDPELRLKVIPASVAAYAIAKNGNGFGCRRCEYARDSEVGADSQGRDLWCGVWGCRVMPTGCCDESEPEGGTVAIDERGNPT